MWRHKSKLPSALARATLSVALQLATCALAQSAPVSWNHPWHSPDEQQFVRDAIAEYTRELPQNSAKTYTLAELIDIAESNSPETRVAEQRQFDDHFALTLEGMADRLEEGPPKYRSSEDSVTSQGSAKPEAPEPMISNQDSTLLSLRGRIQSLTTSLTQEI